MALQTTEYVKNDTALIKEYNDRKLLEIAKTKTCFADYGQMRSLPKGNGKTVNYRRWNLFDPYDTVTKLTEGTIPEGLNLSQTEISATIEQYGAYVKITDVLDDVAFDDVVEGSRDLLGELLGTVVDHVTRDAMCSGFTVQYAVNPDGDVPNLRSEVSADNKLTVDEIRKAVRTLKYGKARKFTRPGSNGGHYICIVGPSAVYDLQKDPDWKAVHEYQDKENIYNGELGRMYGVVFVESTESKVFLEAGKGGADVHATLVFGADAYGVIKLEGAGVMQLIVKPRGSAGTGDPLDQISTIGAKVHGYTAKILNDDWIVRIEHGASV